MREVARAIGADSRIGPKFLNAGPGFGAAVSRRTSSIWCISAGIRPAGGGGLLGERGGIEHLATAPYCSVSGAEAFGTVTGKRLAILVLPLRPTPTTPVKPRQFASVAIFWRRGAARHP